MIGSSEHIGPPCRLLQGTPQQKKNLVAFLSSLGGVPVGPAANGEPTTPQAINAGPEPGARRVAYLLGQREWQSTQRAACHQPHNCPAFGRQPGRNTLSYSPLETTPLVVDGVMYVTGPNQLLALDATTRCGDLELLACAQQCRNISGDAARGASRGAALLGDRLFFITDNAHLLCLHRLTGAVLWEVAMPEQPGRYGGTSAPLVADDLVIGGVSGGDEDISGFVAAYRATTGERVWRTWTVPRGRRTPRRYMERRFSNPKGGASWLTPSYDQQTGCCMSAPAILIRTPMAMRAGATICTPTAISRST